MAQTSDIEWTDATWNPVRGCVKVSPGCKHCYAETFAERFRGVRGHPFEQGFDLKLVPEKLPEPLRWRTPKTIFVNSMSDLFQTGVGTDYVTAVARVMEQANWHTYQVLTKRSERMLDLLTGELSWAAQLPHVWWGVSVENRKHGLPRVEHLRHTKARVRFLSIEPLLEDLGPLDLRGIDWVIVGGESGAGCRPMKEDWVVSIRNQCLKAGVPFFFKQWGGFPKKAAGRLLGGKTWDDMPIRPEVEVPAAGDREMLVERAATAAAQWRPARSRGLARAP
ncbi:MAG: phage Gp37/Gp68 family protein [Myxococcales bacterium]|nr:phage Gp37/Gp68 family protein [Myxococcales bacterium]